MAYLLKSTFTSSETDTTDILNAHSLVLVHRCNTLVCIELLAALLGKALLGYLYCHIFQPGMTAFAGLLFKE